MVEGDKVQRAVKIGTLEMLLRAVLASVVVEMNVSSVFVIVFVFLLLVTEVSG